MPVTETHPGAAGNGTTPAVLYADLERALLATDPYWEAALAGVRRDPTMLFRLAIAWGRGGRRGVCRLLHEVLAALPDFEIPLRPEAVKALRDAAQNKLPIVLVTDLPEAWARSLVRRLGLTAEVSTAENAPPVGIPGTFPSAAIFTPPPFLGTAQLRAAVRLLRPHQWVKNLLLLVPPLVGHQWGQQAVVGAAMVAFVAFCAAASAVYVLNDLLDLEADRQHPHKRGRPLAAGDLPLRVAPLLVLLLCGIAAACAWLLPLPFAGLLGLYGLSSLTYAVWLKHKPMIDVVLLAGLYTLRVLAGGAATQIVPSEWLLGFSLFMFMSLALAKRHAELYRLKTELGWGTRGYLVHDLGLIQSLGAASGYLAVLVLALYIHAPSTRMLYQHPQYLWLLCPLLLYWVSRLWLIACRGLLHEDPIVFAFHDRVSLMVALLHVAILGIATVPFP